MNKIVIKPMLSIAVLSALSAPAMADSVHEWGPWDSAPPVEEHARFTNFAQHFAIASEQQRLGTNGGELLEGGAGGAAWVGYVLSNSSVTTQSGVSSFDEVNSPNKVATIALNPLISADVCTNRCRGGGSITITSDTRPEYNIAFNSQNNSSKDNEPYSNYRTFGVGAEGSFNGALEPSEDNFTYIEGNGTQINTEDYGAYLAEFNVDIKNTVNSPYKQFSLDGHGRIGKLMPLADIAAAAAANAVYSFSGESVFGSTVNLSVNFKAATWSGSWGGAPDAYNGFNASGNIAGTTLSSTSVAGRGASASGGFVQGGAVTASFIGVLNAGDTSNAGIIGKTELNVGATVSTAVIKNDVFQATIQSTVITPPGGI